MKKSAKLMTAMLLVVLLVVTLVACGETGETGGQQSGNNINCTISFDSNGGSAVADMVVDGKSEITIPQTTKEGYFFAGWFVDNGTFNERFDMAYIKANLTKTAITAYAKWTINKYTLTFNSNGGSDVAPITQDYNTSVTRPTDPTKTGYIFEAWYKDSNLSTAFNFATDMLTENTTLFAKWTANQYTLTFNSNGGSDVAPITQDYNTSVTRPTDPTKTGYIFEAWYKDSNLSTAFNFATDMLTEDTTLFAKWTANQYTLTFNSNGGSDVAPITQDYNTLVAKPTDPTKTGYTFEAWYKDSNFATPFNFATDKLTENTTLFANWTINKYTFTFNSNGGSDVAPITQDYNTLVAKPTDPTKTGYTFEAWYKDSNLTTAFNFAKDKLTEDTTLYAKWTANQYTLTFNSNDGSAVAPITQDYNTLVVKPTDPTKMGYTFEAWYKESSLSIIFDFATDKLTENTTLFANWTINKYTFTFNSNGGSDVASITQDYNTSVTKPTDPTKTENVFGGWYLDNNTFSNLYTFSTMPAENIQLYAKWTAKQYTLTFNSNGGSAVASITKDYNTLVGKPTDPTKTGYTFEAWYKDSNLTTAFNFAKDKLTENTTLYANWTINKYTLTFNSNGGSAVAPIAQDYNTLVSKPTDPTKTGYTFEAWYKDSNLTTAFNFAKDKLTENTMLYAKWTANQYTLAFNSNGGSAVAPIAQDYNTLVSKPTDPTKGENVFGGWYKDINFATAFNFAKDKLTENTTLYAKWITVASADLFDFTFTDNTNTAYSIKKKANVTLPNEIALPSSYNGVHVTSIGERAFKGCSGLTEVTIPDSVTSIGMLAFNECSGLTSITIPNSVTSIGKNAFDGCSGLTSITIPTSVTSIGNYAFCYCRKLTTITIPNSVTSIGEGAFSGCSGLTSITIGSGVKSIGQGAFSFCWKLTSITVDKGNTTYHSAGNCIIETAKDTLVLGCNNSIIPTDGSVTSIGEYAFDGCSGLTSITIPTSVTSIGAHAFYDCSNLKSITIPNSVTSIGGWAFLGCNGLTSVIIPSSVTSIGSQAFSGCSGLTSITIPNSVTSIGRYVFENCTKLATINCKAASQPSGWEERWNELCNATVVWGYTGA